MKTLKERIKKEGTCSIWIGSKKVNGYGEIRQGKKKVLAHRFIYELKHGKIPKGMLILHSCDTPSCINMKHLRLGTPKDNMIDKSKRLRSNQSDLTKKDIIEIRALCKKGILQKDIALRFGVHKSTVSHIKNKRTNSHI